VHAGAAAWGGFTYVSLVSMFLAFFAWYRGLAAGGVARVSQLQLLQPFMTAGFAALFLGERFSAGAAAAAATVAMSIIVGRRSRIDRAGVAWRSPPDASPRP
jgi:drug/metabolite transporter (DMT)-like permease